MRKLRINLEDLMIVLESMQESGGTTEVLVFEHSGLPAICDADEPDNIITFSADEGGEELH